jgi:DNA-binding beta-propeller fold protein YncE
VTNPTPVETYRYQLLPGWGALPPGWSLVEVAGVATDSTGRVFVFNRGEHPIVIFDPEGKFLSAWGEGQFARPHGIHIGPDDILYLTDDRDHTVKKYTPDGRRLGVLGQSGRASDTGVAGDYRSVVRGGPPFNLPTNVARGPSGELYVTDGYGNARVHKFGPDGTLLKSWGEPGAGPGQFHLPHGIAVDGRGRVIVADRENSRLQLFSPEGEFLAEWTDVIRPCEVFVDERGTIFVAELGRRAGLFPWMDRDPKAVGGRVSIFDPEGALLARWGGGDDPLAPGNFYAPHDVWVDARGTLYVGEVVRSAGGYPPEVASRCPPLRVFRRGRGPA